MHIRSILNLVEPKNPQSSTAGIYRFITQHILNVTEILEILVLKYSILNISF